MSKKRKRLSLIGTMQNQPLKKKRKTSIGSSGMFFLEAQDGNEHLSFSSRKVEEEEEEEEEIEEHYIVPPPSYDVNRGKKSTQNLKKKSNEMKETIIATREREIHLDRTIPQTGDDFERLLFSDHNNSYLWIRYMTYQLSLGEIDRARKLGQKALRKIDMKRPDERLNIFISLMNLENYYGTKKSQTDILQFSVQNCGSKKEIYLHQARLYEENKQIDTCNEYYRKKIMKKYPKSTKCMLGYQLYLIRQNRHKESHELFLRVLENFTPKEKRDKTLTKLCIQQYKFGSVLEGHKYFQHLVQTYPKRTDFWSMFIQMETNRKRYHEVRKIFQRLLTVNISKFKKKKYLKRYYEFESKHGTEKDLQNVEKIAKIFVNRQLIDNDNEEEDEDENDDE